MSNNIQNIVKEAISIVEGIDEPYRKIAFQVVLGHLLSSQNELKEAEPIRVISKPSGISKEKKSIDSIIKSDYNWSSTKIQKLNPQGQYLCVLKIALKDFGINQLTASDIQTILIQKFRISKTVNTISMALMTIVGKYLDRIKQEAEYAYRITEEGEKRLEYLITKFGGK